jgi:preprotein translocase subunit SecB
LSVPPYELEHKIELLKPEFMVVTYRLYTAPLELMLATNRNAFHFDVRITAEFSIGPEMPREQVEAFASAGALLVIWPFMRQSIADLSMRLGFPPLFLPLLTVPVAPPQTECPTDDR